MARFVLDAQTNRWVVIDLPEEVAPASTRFGGRQASSRLRVTRPDGEVVSVLIDCLVSRPDGTRYATVRNAHLVATGHLFKKGKKK